MVGHYARHLDTEAGIVGDGSLEKGDGALLSPINKNLGKGDARGVVDGDVAIVLAAAARTGDAGAPALDAMAGSREAAELVDIDGDQLAGILPLGAADRFGRL